MSHRKLRRDRRFHQRTFRFVERRERLARTFKFAIATATIATAGLLLAFSSSGRYAASWTFGKLQRVIDVAVGKTNDREWIDAEWRRRRLFDMDQARTKLRTSYAGSEPAMQRLLDKIGLDPDHALLRWGNFDKALLLPSSVFEVDDAGRSYRLRPSFRSIWVRNMKNKEGVLAYFPMPDDPEVLSSAKEAGATIIAESVQTTNSWGLRGGEPDLAAGLRGIVLGDSYMQGLFVGDEETPTAFLKRALAERLRTTVEILNTGTLGYSPEQEYFTLLEYAERFPPRFVVLSLFANDFGDLFEVLEGRADWEENRYWIGKISEFCNGRGIPLLVVPAPWVTHVENERETADYPGRIPAILPPSSHYFDPMERFMEAQLRESLERAGRSESPTPSALFNGPIGDGHFSVRGCRLWGDAVSQRLELLLNLQAASRTDGSAPFTDETWSTRPSANFTSTIRSTASSP